MRKTQRPSQTAKSKAKSNRQRRQELDVKRTAKRASAEKAALAAAVKARAAELKGEVLVNESLLAPTGSYDRPAFVKRGFYVDELFTCVDCGAKEVWTATQQKWWYEIAKGDMWSTARRCRPCRCKVRAQKQETLRVQAERTARNATRVRLPKSSRRSGTNGGQQ